MSDDPEWSGFWIGRDPEPSLDVTYLGPAGGRARHLYRFLIEAAAPGISAEFEGFSKVGALTAFRDAVDTMHETVRGGAVLTFDDGSLDLRGELDRYGHVRWRIILRGGPAAEQQFEINEDQTMLWNVVAHVNRLLRTIADRRKPSP